MSFKSRQNYNTGTEIIIEDHNQQQGRAESGLFDFVVLQMLGNKQNAFFQDSFKVLRVDSTSCISKLGLGFQNLVTSEYEPENKPLHMDADKTLQFDAPDSTYGRIDIVVVKAILIDGDTATRKYKDVNTDEIVDVSVVVNKVWSVDVQVITGTASASPEVPATPAGYLKIAEVSVEAVNGIVAESNITDLRELLPFCTSTSTSGSLEYDAIVGSIPQATHASLYDALAEANDNCKILVVEDQVIDAGEVPTVANSGIEIKFKDASIIKGTATQGMIISSSYCKLDGARFQDFSSAGDIALQITAGSYSEVTGTRYNNCDTNLDDSGANTIELYSITE